MKTITVRLRHRAEMNKRDVICVEQLDALVDLHVGLSQSTVIQLALEYYAQYAVEKKFQEVNALASEITKGGKL